MSFLKLCVRVLGIGAVVILSACSSSSGSTTSSGDGGGGGGNTNYCCISGAYYGCPSLDAAKACLNVLDAGAGPCTRDSSSDSKCG